MVDWLKWAWDSLFPTTSSRARVGNFLAWSIVLSLFISKTIGFSGCIKNDYKNEVEARLQENEKIAKEILQRREEHWKKEIESAWPKKDEAYKKLQNEINALATKLAEKEKEVQTLNSEQANEKLGWQTELQVINQQIGDLRKKWGDDKIALEKTKTDLMEARKALESKKKL